MTAREEHDPENDPAYDFRAPTVPKLRTDLWLIDRRTGTVFQLSEVLNRQLSDYQRPIFEALQALLQKLRHAADSPSEDDLASLEPCSGDRPPGPETQHYMRIRHDRDLSHSESCSPPSNPPIESSEDGSLDTHAESSKEPLTLSQAARDLFHNSPTNIISRELELLRSEVEELRRGSNPSEDSSDLLAAFSQSTNEHTSAVESLLKSLTEGVGRLERLIRGGPGDQGDD